MAVSVRLVEKLRPPYTIFIMCHEFELNNSWKGVRQKKILDFKIMTDKDILAKHYNNNIIIYYFNESFVILIQFIRLEALWLYA